MRNRLKALAALLVAYVLILAGWVSAVHAQQGTAASYVVGERNVTWYNFGKGSVQGAYISNGNTSTGAQTITVCPAYRPLPDGRVVNLFGGVAGIAAVPITVDPQSSTNSETVTPTAVSLTTPQFVQGSNQAVPCANITATFANTHAASLNTHQVISGDGGLQEAINDAQLAAGGEVAIGADSSITNTQIAAAVPYPGVIIVDRRGGFSTQYWTPGPTTTAFVATPTALTAQAACDATHTFCSDASAVGTWTSGTLFGCVAYVDVMGNEGACSTTASFTTVVSKAVDVAAPAASTGAVGYTIYLSLIGGSYAFAYQVPITSTICKLTTVETVTPACAVANTTYGQSAANAQIAAITVNTSPLALQLGVASTTADYVGNSNAHTIYSYVAGALGAPGLVNASLAFTAGPATVATTVPQVIGTLAIPAGFMNQVGKTIRLCGKEQMTNNSATVEQIQIWWDGAGSNAAGVPVNIANLQVGGTGTAVAYNGAFCTTLTTTVSGAGVTAGSIRGGNGTFYLGIASAPVGSFTPGTDTFTAATASLNLAGGAGFTSRIHIVQLHTTGTDVSPQLASLTAEVLN